MPVVYINLTGSAVTPPGSPTVQAGDQIALYRYLADPCGLTVNTDIPAPWETQHSDVIGAGIALTDLAKFKELHILNNTGAVIEFTVNSDTSNVRAVLDKDSIKIEQDREIDTMAISGAGAGKVYVYGTL